MKARSRRNPARQIRRNPASRSCFFCKKPTMTIVVFEGSPAKVAQFLHDRGLSPYELDVQTRNGRGHVPLYMCARCQRSLDLGIEVQRPTIPDRQGKLEHPVPVVDLDTVTADRLRR